MRKKSALKTEEMEISKKVLTCNVCNKTGFTTTYKLNSHLFLHKAIPARYKCSYCYKEYFRSDEYSRHMAVHRRKQRLYFCDHCERGFVDKRNLILHLRVHDDLPRLSDLRYTCAACGANYCEERLLKYHIRKQHLNLENAEPIHITKNINDTWIENLKNQNSCVQITKIKPNTLMIKRCKIKGKICENDGIKGNICENDGIKGNICENGGIKGNICENHKDIEKDVFHQYIASIFATTGNNYSKAVCDYCNKEMLKKSIVTHIRERHLKIRRFNCEVCKRTFKRNYQLGLHNCGVRRRRKKVENQL